MQNFGISIGHSTRVK